MRESNPFKIGEQMLIMEQHEQVIRNRLGVMAKQEFVQRFWEKDARLWQREPGDPSIVGAMGWLRVAETMRERIPELVAFADEIKKAGFERVVLAGMGGSSLAPLVLAEVLARNSPSPASRSLSDLSHGRGDARVGQELAGESAYNPPAGGGGR